MLHKTVTGDITLQYGGGKIYPPPSKKNLLFYISLVFYNSLRGWVGDFVSDCKPQRKVLVPAPLHFHVVVHDDGGKTRGSRDKVSWHPLHVNSVFFIVLQQDAVNGCETRHHFTAPECHQHWLSSLSWWLTRQQHFVVALKEDGFYKWILSDQSTTLKGHFQERKKKRLKKSCEEVRKHKIKHVSQIRCYYTNKLISMVIIMKQYQATMPPYCSLENPEENAGCSECLELRPKQVSSLWRCCEHILTSRWSQILSKLGGHANKPGAAYS